MDELLKAADKVLSLIPFDGDKTTIGMGLKFALPILAAHFPVVLIAAPVVTAVADFLLLTGLLHKPVKALARN